MVRSREGEELLGGAGKIIRAASAIQTEAVAAQGSAAAQILDTDASVLASVFCSMELLGVLLDAYCVLGFKSLCKRSSHLVLSRYVNRAVCLAWR